MDPSPRPGSRVLLVSLLWVPLIGYLTFRGSGAVMTASGPSGGLVGISSRALFHTALLAIGPRPLLVAAWLGGRSRPDPPVPKESATGGQRSKRQSR